MENAPVFKEVIAVLRPERWAETKARLRHPSLAACTQQRVLGRGRERGLRYLPRRDALPGTGIRCLPHRLICWMVEESLVEPLIQALLDANRTDRSGDGRIFVLPVSESRPIFAESHDAETQPAELPFEAPLSPAYAAAPQVAHAPGQ